MSAAEIVEQKGGMKFIIEAPKINPAGGSGDVAAIRKAAGAMRAKLMTFPNATLVENQKVGDKTAIVISVKGKKDETQELPKDLDYMDFKGDKPDNFLAEYQLKNEGFKVFVKNLGIKVSSLSPNKNKIMPRSPIKWQKKRKRDVVPEGGSPSKWPASGFKLPRSKNVPVAKPVKFEVSLEVEQKTEKKTGAKHDVKRAAIVGRKDLMEFPGARRLRCKKTDDSYSIVIYAKSVPSPLPAVKSLEMNGDKYKYKGYDVVVKAEKMKVKGLKTKKWKVKQQVRKKWVKKTKPAEAPKPAEGTESEITGGCKLASEPVSKKKPARAFWTDLLVESDKGDMDVDKKVSDKKKLKKVVQEKRRKLMTFPGALRLTCSKKGNDYWINLYVKKGTQVPVKNDQGFMDLQKPVNAVALSEYLLKDHPYRVLIKEQPSFKIKSLRVSKRKPGKVQGKKWMRKDKPSELPKAAPDTPTEWPGKESEKTKRD